MVVYVAKSMNREDVILANNSAILYDSPTCSGCVTEFYCLSNSTLSGVGEVVFPDGTVHTTDSVERLAFSTLRVQLSNSQPTTGIFTCRLPDTNGNILEASIGLYSTTIREFSLC